MAQPSKHRWVRFLREVRDELAKVVWPNRREVVTYTVVVILTVLAVGLFVFGLDVLLSRMIVELFDE
ncbi:MAG TPA: preprotein translocase subunit SecE [Actinomycetota bacterium]|nr:preprotein translocase subunit SecE [Actinomycetota bacterium]